MTMTSYTFDPDLANRYLDLCFDLYRDDANWIPPLRRRLLRKFLPEYPFYGEAGNGHRSFLATAAGKPVGHISALVNRRLHDPDGTPVGTVGFFECIDDPTVAAELFGAACDWLRTEYGLRRVWGPMQFNAWEGYRLMTRGFDTATFFGEPYNKRYYPAFFERNGFAVRKQWYSVEISGSASLRGRLEPWANDYARAVDDGYRFTPINARDPVHVDALHMAVENSYRGFLGLTRLGPQEFQEVFGRFAALLDPRFAIAAWSPKGGLAGFAIAYPDYSRAIRAMHGSESLPAKLRFHLWARAQKRAVFFMIGITAEESARRRGLGRAMFCSCLRSLIAAGFESVVMALLAEDSPGWQLLGDCKAGAQKEYALYEARNEP